VERRPDAADSVIDRISVTVARPMLFDPAVQLVTIIRPSWS
jgi:hypothetical protein